MNRLCSHQAGFTLLELLVASAVFTVLSIMAYGGLRTVLTARAETDRAAARLAEIQTAFLHIHRDIIQITDRSIRAEYGDQQPALKYVEFGDYRLELTRGGVRNPAGLPRSNLQRVAYSLEDETLYRVTWPVLDRAQDTQPRRVRLLGQVRGLHVRFLGTGEDWQTAWPPIAQEGEVIGLPRAVELSVDLEDWGRLTRLFEVPGV